MNKQKYEKVVEYDFRSGWLGFAIAGTLTIYLCFICLTLVLSQEKLDSLLGIYLILIAIVTSLFSATAKIMSTREVHYEKIKR
jgi:phosphatidylglycerophosphate synthase